MTDPELAARPLRLALSGGGFRATLFSLGTMLYLVDSGQNRTVRSVYSVSGASFLNGLVAQSVDLRSAGVRDIDDVAVRLLRTITTRGLLRSSWVTPAYIGVLVVLAGFLSTGVAVGWPRPLGWPMLGAAAVLLPLLWLLRGVLLTSLIAREFFRPAGRPTTLGDVSSSTRHVICATDLNAATPAFFAMGGDGAPMIHLAMGDAQADGYRLDHAVRASAAFPGGIPPKRLRLAPLGISWRWRTHGLSEAALHMAGERLRRRPGKAVYLADGGVYNNLATERVPDDVPDGPVVVLVVDASAPTRTARLGWLAVPALAEIVSLARSTSILYANTVEPRIADFETTAALALRLQSDPDGPTVDFPVVVRITDNTSTAIRRLLEVERRAGLDRRGDARAGVTARDEQVATSRGQWNDAAKALRDRYDHRVMAVRSSRIKTTLGRIDGPEALGLMVHGYLSAMISLAHTRGAPNGTLDLDRFERLLRFEPGDRPAFTDDADVL